MPNDQRFYSLIELKTTTEVILHSHFNRKYFCTEVRESINEAGERNYTVYISDAMPEDYDLQRQIMQKLHDHGYHGIEVITEW